MRENEQGDYRHRPLLVKPQILRPQLSEKILKPNQPQYLTSCSSKLTSPVSSAGCVSS
jgi:hypothetical protein